MVFNYLVESIDVKGSMKKAIVIKRTGMVSLDRMELVIGLLGY